jgi:serine/threonine-protein kinase
MKMKIAAVGLLAVLLGTTAIARDDDRYGAIAYSRRTGHYGYSNRADSQRSAERRALESCEGRDCKIQVWFRNSCGALATSENGQTTGWAHDTSLRDAKVTAVEQCRDNGGRRCHVVVSACSR